MKQLKGKPTYYIWKSESISETEVDRIKQYWISLGFRVVIFQDGDNEKDIHTGLKSVIKNHICSR